MKRILMLAALAMLAAVVLPAKGYAQDFGRILIVVTDKSGVAIKEVTVVIEYVLSDGTVGTTITTTTNVDGYAITPGILAGNYVITVSKVGFKTIALGTWVISGEDIRISFEMEDDD